MREVVVLGVGQSDFGKFPQRTVVELGRDAVVNAIKHAGIHTKDIQVAYASRFFDPMVTAQNVLKEVGLTSIEMINVENGCAGGSTAVRGVWKEIANGNYDIGIAVGVESMTTSSIASKLITPPKNDLEGQLGLTMASYYGQIAVRQMYQFGVTVEDFARVSVKNHCNACLNPIAQYKNRLTIEDVLKSRMICDPITLLECCPNTDGAAAIILCSMKIAKKFTSKPVRIIGSALLSGDYNFLQEDITFTPLCANTARLAYEMAGYGPEDIDVVELHDAFAPEEIMRYDELGLCKRGEGINLLRSGATEIGGRIPVNPSGGLLALGHPLSASGVRNIAEIATQLMGQAGNRQVAGAKVGLAHMMGGLAEEIGIGACSIHILAR